MKILVISLLRLGDILLMLPAIKALKNQNPNAEVHVLINKQFSFIKSMIPFIDKFHFFDRDYFQASMADVDTPILNAFDVLSESLKKIDRENFNVVYNLTHTNVSGHVVSAISASEKWGLFFRSNNVPQIKGRWFQYLNKPKSETHFHFTEIFLNAVGGKSLPYVDLKESSGGILEAENILQKKEVSKNIVLIQAFSNDTKKDFNTQFLLKYLSRLYQSRAGVEFYVLGAPFEAKKVNSLIELAEKEYQLKLLSAICSFEGAYSLLKRSSLLISVDTSIKHLAGYAGTKIIEFAFGSSYTEHTGAFYSPSLIFKPKVECYPCEHTKDCIFPKRICSESDVMAFSCAEMSLKFLEDENSIFELKADFDNYCAFEIPYVFESGLRVTRKSGNKSLNYFLLEILEKEKIRVEFAGQKDVLVGSEAYGIIAELKRRFNEKELSELKFHIERVEKEIFQKVQKNSQLDFLFSNALSNGLKNFDWQEFSQCERSINQKSPHVKEGNLIYFSRIRQLQEELKFSRQIAEFEERLTRTMKGLMTEII